MTAPRFSKAAMIAHLDTKAQALRNKYGFDPGNGWAQCERIAWRMKVSNRGLRDEHPPLEEVHRAYGEWRTLVDLIRDIECGMVNP